jgi:hypothetical protein
MTSGFVPREFGMEGLTNVAFDFHGGMDGLGAYKWDGGRHPLHDQKARDKACRYEPE